MTVDDWNDKWMYYYEAQDAYVENGSQGPAPQQPQWDNSGGNGPPPPPPRP